MEDFLSDSEIRDQDFDIVSIKVITDFSQDISFDHTHLILVCLTWSLRFITVVTLLNLSPFYHRSYSTELISMITSFWPLTVCYMSDMMIFDS